MSQAFDLQSLLWLIHTEIATAVNTVKSEQAPLEMKQVRVRMGQNSDEMTDEVDAVTLPTERYPAAAQGWLVDVLYDASQNQARTTKAVGIESGTIPNGWQGVSEKTPVVYLEGVGLKRERDLQQLEVFTLGDLLAVDVSKLGAADQARYRRLQTLACMGLQLPPMALTQQLSSYTVLEFIEQPGLLENTELSSEAKSAFYQWLLQLEICFDDRWLRKTPLQQLIDYD
ncbi:MAG: hypothetical protein U9R28_04315 [Pseudomonadota bacterium]|nr:hypothetical protein [Pseudomonadota bacterium]